MSAFYQRSARFYITTPEGVVPFAEVPKKSGEGMRKATIADAKDRGAYPSVTTILQTLAKPGLESWKMRKVAEAALTLPRIAGESDEDFISRIADDAFEESGDAADMGTAIHDSLSQWIEFHWKGGFKFSGHLYTGECVKWLKSNVESVSDIEKVVANNFFGYAGRMDLACFTGGVSTIIDFKSQKVKRSAKGEAKPLFYSEWPLQLASYARAYGLPAPKLISIVIDTTEPGPCFVKDWTEEHTCSYYFDIFTKVLDLWRYNNEW